MSRRRKLRAAVVGVALLIVLAQVVPLTAAASGISWAPMRRGLANNKGYNRANMTQSTDYGIDESTTWNYSIYFEDNDWENGTGYAWPYCDGSFELPEEDCPWQLAVFFERTANAGVNWQDRVMLNDLNGDGDPEEDGSRVALCSVGSNVYTAWTTQTEYYTKNVGLGPRAARFRASSDFGGTWGAVQAVTDLAGQIDYTSMACADQVVTAKKGNSNYGRIFMSYTDSKTGEIHLRTSDNGGGSWSDQVLGTTKAMIRGPQYDGPGGYGGRPMVATSDDGETVGVAWQAPEKKRVYNPTKIMVRTSTDGGQTWAPVMTLAKDSGRFNMVYVGRLPSGSSGATDRIAFSNTNAARDEGYVWEFQTDSGWEPKRTFTTMPNSLGNTEIASVGVGLQGTSQTAVAYGGCWDDPCQYWKSAGIDLLFQESYDNGQTWTDPEVIGVGGLPGGGYNFLNVGATVVYNGADIRYVMWQGTSEDWWHNQRQFRRGTTGG